MSSSKKPVRPIDRIVPGDVGRITVRVSRLRKETRDDLDRAITRAIEHGHMDALRMLKDRRIDPLAFLSADRQGKVASLQPEELLEPLVDSWLASCGRKKGSIARYRQSWKFLYASLPSAAKVNHLTNRWWIDFATERAKVVGSATLNRDRAALLAFSSWAKDQGLDVPEMRIKKLKESPKKSGILKPGQLELIAEHCRVDRWPFFWVLLETGARQGEILNLTGPDIDGNRPAIRIRPQEGSKGARERFVGCSAELHNCLLTLAAVAGDGRLFPYGRRTVQEWWAALCKKVGIEGVSLHGLRSNFITRALDAGVSLVQVQKLVGHSDVSMTMSYYRNPKESLEAADKIREAIGFAAPKSPAVAPEPAPMAIPATPARRKR